MTSSLSLYAPDFLWPLKTFIFWSNARHRMICAPLVKIASRALHCLDPRADPPMWGASRSSDSAAERGSASRLVEKSRCA